jgi:hypothetical protein
MPGTTARLRQRIEIDGRNRKIEERDREIYWRNRKIEGRGMEIESQAKLGSPTSIS